MTLEQEDRTVVSRSPTTAASDVGVSQQAVQTRTRRVTNTAPGGAELARRAVVLVFGLVQILIAARIVLLLLDARETNGLVSGILNMSQLFVAPFDGILRSNSLHAAGSVLDLSAVLAFVGWTIVELIVIWIVAIFRRDEAHAGA